MFMKAATVCFLFCSPRGLRSGRPPESWLFRTSRPPRAVSLVTSKFTISGQLPLIPRRSVTLFIEFLCVKLRINPKAN